MRPLFLGVAGGAFAVSICVPLSHAQTVGLDQLRAHALALVNEARRTHDLPPLLLGRAANAAAEAHAGDMRKRRYYAHVSPEGGTAQDRFIRAGGNRSQLTAENIAQCPECKPPSGVDLVEALHRGWLDSPGHRENILMAGLTTFGFGIVTDREQGMYAVQVFAGPGRPRDLQPGDPSAPLPAAEQGRRALALLNEVRRQQAIAELRPGSALEAAAATLLLRHGQDDSRIADGKNLRNALPVEQRRDWPSLGVLVASCGGCGAAPTVADVRYFLQQWREHPDHRSMLLDAQWTHVGFRIAADGEGKKVAVALFGTDR